MSNHTPGPWECSKPQWKRGGPPYKIAIYGANGTIANVLTHDAIWADGCGTRPSSEINDDARLIAAAPELLEACEDALATNNSDMQHILDNGRLRSVLQKAIAKAKGELE